MPLIAGTVVVDPSGAATGVGLAKDLYDAEVGAYGSDFSSAADAQSVLAKQKIAAKCAAQATVFVAFVKTATITVTCPPGGGVVVGVVT